MKEEFKVLFLSLSMKEQKKILEWYGIHSVQRLMENAKDFAKTQIKYADLKGYGYGEMGYYFKQLQEEMEEEEFLKPIAKRYALLAEWYFEKLIEINEL